MSVEKVDELKWNWKEKLYGIIRKTNSRNVERFNLIESKIWNKKDISMCLKFSLNKTYLF